MTLPLGLVRGLRRKTHCSLRGARVLGAFLLVAASQPPPDAHYAQPPQAPVYVNGQMLVSGTWAQALPSPNPTVSPSHAPPATNGAQYKACLNRCAHMSNKATYEQDMNICMPMCNSWPLQ
jgi:hypothetical protein